MVRLKLSFINGKGEWLSTHAQTFDCDSMSAWTSKIRPGGWYELWSFELGDSSVALGIGFMEPSCKVNMNRGFIEFNPNKVAGDKRFWRLLEKLAPCVSHARLKRFDLAYDLPTSRLDCRLSKDRRMYKSVISNGITEYLGVKNTPGYVKVYDKAAEMHLSGVLTRIELTCDGEWDAWQVVAHWPQVHAWHSDENTRDWVRVLGIMLAEKSERGEEVETLINMLGWRSRPKVREYLRTPMVELPPDCAAAAVAEARKAELVTEIADKEGDLAELDSQLEDVKLDIEDEQDRLECLRQRADGVARDVGELRPIAAEVRGWEAAGKAERGAILDRIAAQCDGLASRIRAGVAGIRLKVEELRSLISRPLEYLMRREQPRQQSLNDVLRDAQRAADAWNRDHAAPQRTYRGRAR